MPSSSRELIVSVPIRSCSSRCRTVTMQSAAVCDKGRANDLSRWLALVAHCLRNATLNNSFMVQVWRFRALVLYLRACRQRHSAGTPS
eukprot:3489985-Prymnesium_polylepis.1